MPTIVQPYHSIQYDGTNGSYIFGTWCTRIPFVSDTGTILTYLQYDGDPRTVNLGEWVVVDVFDTIEPQIYTQSGYAARFYELPEA
jgi:hypothetical protein